MFYTMNKRLQGMTIPKKILQPQKALKRSSNILFFLKLIPSIFITNYFSENDVGFTIINY